MSVISGHIAELQTSNGTVYAYAGDTAAKVILQSMAYVEAVRSAAQQSQVEAIANALEGSRVEPVSTIAIISAIAGVVGTAAAVSSAAAGATSAGVGLASLVSQSEVTGKDSLEVLFKNLTALPIVLASYSTSDSSSASMPGPIEPGGDDTAVIVNSNGSFGKGDSEITMKFFTGGGFVDDQQVDVVTPIDLVCNLSYTSDGYWAPTIAIDGSNGISSSSYKKEAFAVYFKSSDDNIMDLTIASMGIEKGTAEPWFHFLPGSPIIE